MRPQSSVVQNPGDGGTMVAMLSDWVSLSSGVAKIAYGGCLRGDTIVVVPGLKTKFRSSAVMKKEASSLLCLLFTKYVYLI